ncbi:S9 family peptidase [Paenibacillus radicis (ex Xue et al. 2023)]|uniref:S9 family peptidase n=1 Tax=Paenibacillus radicis (ex Xue et al. 2023) TaxID=2972489 RepID=A0ABT1YFA3_9BACL|nr:S9 family peptidase [Paenibacillus radicis (ex Xue et al. 2023)]MCR8631876.1 S9 family peptidase [Paenibacillus radicis (ex Xue et al. 2023)]
MENNEHTEDNSTLQAYLNVILAYQPQVVPHRNRVTFITKKTGLPQLWSWDAAESSCKQVVQLPDRVMAVKHSSCGFRTVIGMDHKGNEKQQLYMLDNETLNVQELVFSPEHFHHLGSWSPCGKKITFSSNRRGPGLFDLYVLDVETKQLEVVYRHESKCVPLSWLPDGSGLLFVTDETSISQHLYVLDLQDGGTRRIGLEGAGVYTSVQLCEDGTGYFITNAAENTMALYCFSADRTGADLLCHIPEWDIEEAKLSPDRSRIAYTVNEGGMSVLYMYNLESGSSEATKGQPKGVIQSLSWLNEEQLVFALKSPIQPGDVWSYRTNDTSFQQLTHFGAAESIAHLLREPELCTFKSFDGVEVPYFYYRPDSSRYTMGQSKSEGAALTAQKSPTVVYVHGGPESQIRFEFQPVIQYLVGKGFNVIAPNVRGSMGYGKNYLNLDNRRKRMDTVADLAEMVKDLGRFEEIDTANIGIMGRSYGGFMVLAALTHYPDLWAAGVDIVGITHFRTFLQNTGEWRRKLRESEYGTLADDSDFFEEIAPFNHSHKIKVPLLIFHGRNDTRVPVTEAEQLFADMQARGQEAELVIFEDEGHQTEKMENHIAMNSRIIRFFRRHLEK